MLFSQMIVPVNRHVPQLVTLQPYWSVITHGMSMLTAKRAKQIVAPVAVGYF